jgi:glycosyltransferase involved in cell wall biosynthesis
MIDGNKISVVLPAYNAERTLLQTYKEIPKWAVDDIILTDDGSSDRTVKMAQDLGIHTLVHAKNRGYGANQKTCYREALSRGADVIVMLHPDYQYSPQLLPALVAMILSGNYDIALASRILGRGARAGGMPLYKYIANRTLTAIENLLLGHKLSEYHTGYRAWSRRALASLPFERCSDDFVFDNQVLVQAIHQGFKIGEISCPTHYFADASSINFRRSVTYGFGVLSAAADFRLNRMGIRNSKLLAVLEEDSHTNSTAAPSNVRAHRS